MNAAAPDLALARLLQGELAAKYVLSVPIERRDVLPGGHPVILIGGPRNPLVTEYCHRHNVGGVKRPEGYVLQVGADAVVLAGRR